MTAEVISFEVRRPHSEGAARCLDCRHEWHGVAPTGVVWLECPKCSLVRGRFVFPHQRGAEKWECGCGNDLFHANRDGVYCPNCGDYQRFPA